MTDKVKIQYLFITQHLSAKDAALDNTDPPVSLWQGFGWPQRGRPRMLLAHVALLGKVRVCLSARRAARS